MSLLEPETFDHHVYGYYTGEFRERVEIDSDPEIVVESKGLTRDGLRLDSARTKFAEAGLSRDRDILVARGRGRVLGYSILDYTSLGASLSFFFNAFYLSMFEDHDAAERMLAAASINHYLDKGRPFAVGLSSVGNDAVLESVGLRRHKEYAEMTMSKPAAATTMDHFKAYYSRVQAA
jgi:hypothetical protein